MPDLSISTLHAALNGLSARQRAISDDIANVNTPFYRARTVSFEDDLRRALRTGADPSGVRPVVRFSSTPDTMSGLTDNNVSLPDATVASMNTQMAYELVMRATGDRFTVLRAAGRAV